MNKANKNGIVVVAFIGGLIVVLILVLGTFWSGRSASEDTQEAVRSVSLLYLDELAGRREQVVASNLNTNIKNLQIAVGLMTDEDFSDMQHLQAYQSRMKQLYDLEKFAFVDTNGLIYTSTGTQDDIDDYDFDYRTLSQPEISVKNLESDSKKVIIAIPIDNIPFNGETLVVSFMEIDMARMLQGVSMQSSNTDATFCNIYTSDGIPLSNVVLGDQATEDNLFGALQNAQFTEGYSFEAVKKDFESCQRGVVSFSYGSTQEILSYVPVEGTNWMLTYLISESIISDEISPISDGIIMRSLVQSVLTALVLLGMFAIMLLQTRRSAQLALEKETSETESRIKQEELEQRLELQQKLLEQEQRRAQQDSMITALASDYRSVYYIDLDADSGICYRADHNDKTMSEGRRFPFHDAFVEYAQEYVTEPYREGFLHFIDPSNIRKGLEKDLIITYRYLIKRNGVESYEMLRMAGVRHAEDRDDHIVHAVGLGFTDIDAEMRESLAKNEALSDALAAAEEANKAKTVFLSNMSHEIRTPMNAIIGLDNIALNDPDISDKTRDHLEMIGESAQHLLTIINDILDMSRIESGRMMLKNEEFSFSWLLEQVNVMISSQCQDKGLKYSCKINGLIDDYYIGDNVKLRQVLINILSNAVKFTPEGGTVNFSAERIAQYHGKSTIRFVVADTGIGISKDYLPHIFDSFSQEDSSATSKYGSSGLGLAITKNVVEMMNGDIEVESEKGVGTTFTVTVTLIDSSRKESEGNDIEINPQDMTVLVVDDDPVACEHAALVLGKVGIATDTALSGAEAIEMVRLHHARREPYNLILLDWKMPEMDGVETAKRIRDIIGNSSAIIILTAYRWDDVLEEAKQAGVDSFLAKPLFASNVLEEFKEALKLKGGAFGVPLKTDLKGKRVLIAEDVVVNAEIMVMLLQMREMEVEHAENGRIAVEMFQSNAPGYYDAILMDMRMPEMDGLEATTAIRGLDRPDASTIPIIALTANAFDEDVQRSLQAGLNAHLTKPVEPDILFETLESLIPAD